jgi:hypothetical protein
MKPRTPNHANLVICYQIIDLTYVRLGSGFIYLIVIMDVFYLLYPRLEPRSTPGY